MAGTSTELGTAAPDFGLPDTNGAMVSRDEFAGRPLLVMFICNHCPFVKHVRAKLAELGRRYQDRGVGVVGINSNDVANFPDDSPENMKREVAEAGYTFPYLYDETQEVAKAYRAACTPDFFLFDRDHRLVYRGQMDSSRPGNDVPVTGEDLTAAVEAMVVGTPLRGKQLSSAGCRIRWKTQQGVPDNLPCETLPRNVTLLDKAISFLVFPIGILIGLLDVGQPRGRTMLAYAGAGLFVALLIGACLALVGR